MTDKKYEPVIEVQDIKDRINLEIQLAKMYNKDLPWWKR